MLLGHSQLGAQSLQPLLAEWAGLCAFRTARFLLRSTAGDFGPCTTTAAAISTARGFFFGGGRL
jgi:hypothetical protein